MPQISHALANLARHLALAKGRLTVGELAVWREPRVGVFVLHNKHTPVKYELEPDLLANRWARARGVGCGELSGVSGTRVQASYCYYMTVILIKGHPL